MSDQGEFAVASLTEGGTCQDGAHMCAWYWLWLECRVRLDGPAKAPTKAQAEQIHHEELQGVAVEKGGALAVKVSFYGAYVSASRRTVPSVMVMTLPSAGDDVTVVIDETDMVLEVHRQGHREATAVGLSPAKLCQSAQCVVR
jgi:hypothetical protein